MNLRNARSWTTSALLVAALIGSAGRRGVSRCDWQHQALRSCARCHRAEGWRIEKLAEGFTWSEGPVWISSGNYLLFDDVPGNTMYRWSQKDGLSVFLKPSGFEGKDTSMFREAGANGLFPDTANTILVADSGNRQIARLDLMTKRRRRSRLTSKASASTARMTSSAAAMASSSSPIRPMV